MLACAVARAVAGSAFAIRAIIGRFAGDRLACRHRGRDWRVRSFDCSRGRARLGNGGGGDEVESGHGHSHSGREESRRRAPPPSAWSAFHCAIEDSFHPSSERVLARSDPVGADQEAAALVASDADKQLRVVGFVNICRKDRIVGSFLAQLVCLASKQPHEWVEPEDRNHNAGEQKLGPVEACDMRKFVGDYGFGLVVRFGGLAVEQDYRPNDSPADRRWQFVARQKCRAMLEAHALLRPSHCSEPAAVDENRCPRLEHEQPYQRH